MIVQFSNVGRAKKSWRAEIPDRNGVLDAVAMERSIRKSKALMSRDIEVDEDGGIYVGGFRRVGEWSAIKEEAST